MDLEIVGNISRDRVRYPGGQTDEFFGGGGLNVALAIARCGYRASLLSVIGQDDVDLLTQISQAVDITHVSTVAGKTCEFAITYAADGTIGHMECEFGVAEDINTHVQQLPLLPAHYHICCRRPLDSAILLARLGPNRCSFSLDLIVSSASEQIERCKCWFDFAQFIFVNAQEFDILRAAYDIRNIRQLVVTAGPNPVRIFRHGELVLERACGERAHYDVTGAGDAFTGAFLASCVLAGDTISRSVDNAIAMAQSSLMGRGLWRDGE